MKNACQGVLYPIAAASQIQLKTRPQEPKSCTLINSNLTAIEVPHKAWIYCKEELENTFSFLKIQKQEVATVFVFAPLHKGPIDFNEGPKLYTPQDGFLKGSDWQIKLETPAELKALPFLLQNDDICTEEHSLEIIAPFLYKILPGAKVCYLLAPCSSEEICEITSIIGRYYPSSLIFLSNNKDTNCAYMWKRKSL